MSVLRLPGNKRAPRDPKTLKDQDAEPKQSKKRTCHADKLKNNHPNNSLTVINNIDLFCQCCNRKLELHNSTVTRHCEAKYHRENYDDWKSNNTQTQSGIKDAFKTAKLSKNMRMDSITAACMAGIPATQICLYNKLMGNKYKTYFKNSTGLVQSSRELSLRHVKTRTSATLYRL